MDLWRWTGFLPRSGGQRLRGEHVACIELLPGGVGRGGEGRGEGGEGMGREGGQGRGREEERRTAGREGGEGKGGKRGKDGRGG